MKIYRCYWEIDDAHMKTPYFRTVEKAKDCFLDMILKTENTYILEELQEYYVNCCDEGENFEDFIYNVLDGWDICGYETAELID